MKKVIELLPFILLVSLVALSFHSSPNIAQSIILVAITALAGYSYYLMDKIKPDYKKMFEEELSLMNKKSREEASFIKAELNTIREKYGKVSIEQQQAKKKEQFNW